MSHRHNSQISNISDDLRKSISYDIIKTIKSESNHKLTLILTILAILISILSYIGYDHLTKFVVKEVYNAEFNPTLLASINEAEKKLELIVQRGIKLDKKILEDEKHFNKLLSTKKAELLNLTNMIASFEIKNSSIESVINENSLEQIKAFNGFQFIRPLGLSTTTIFKTLVVFGELTPVNTQKQNISTSLYRVQSKFELIPDGKLGPCTSFLLAAVALRYFPTDTKSELKSSMYSKNHWFLNVLKACHQTDKDKLISALNHQENPLHFEMIELVETLGSHKNHISGLLSVKQVDNTAYQVLDILNNNKAQPKVDPKAHTVIEVNRVVQ